MFDDGLVNAHKSAAMELITTISFQQTLHTGFTFKFSCKALHSLSILILGTVNQTNVLWTDLLEVGKDLELSIFCSHNPSILTWEIRQADGKDINDCY